MNADDYLNDDLLDVKEEIETILKYAKKANVEIKDIEKRILTLNYFEADKDNFKYKRRHGKLDYFNMANYGGVCMPFTDFNNNINDIVILIASEYKNNPLYKVHELLHFFSTNINHKRKIICGIDDYDISNFSRSGIVAINEGLTDYFTFKICGNYYNNEYLNFNDLDMTTHKYYYSTLLINLLARNKKAEYKLFNAYINNDVEYIYNELYKNFGFSKLKIEYLFERGEIYAEEKEDKIGLEIYLDDIKDLLNFYSNVNKEDNDFASNYLTLFD